MDLILKYFPEVTFQQQKTFKRLSGLYSEWNEKVNVISRKDIDNLYERHVLHSLSIAKVIRFRKGTEILDIGTGGGFPGIPLAILFPGSQFHLVDSIGKKIKVVKEIVHELSLDNVSSEHARAEKVKGRYDFVTSRAVTDLETLVNWSKGKLKEESKHEFKNGLLVLKGGDIAGEASGIKAPIRKFAISDFFEEVFFEGKWVLHIPMN